MENIEKLKNICTMRNQSKTAGFTTILLAPLNPLSILNIVVVVLIVILFKYTRLNQYLTVDGEFSNAKLGLYSFITYMIIMVIVYYFALDMICKKLGL